jgi:hypothetical protein
MATDEVHAPLLRPWARGGGEKPAAAESRVAAALASGCPPIQNPIFVGLAPARRRGSRTRPRVPERRHDEDHLQAQPRRRRAGLAARVLGVLWALLTGSDR